MAQASCRLQTIKGIGAQGGAMLASLFSCIPFANADALVAYSGLAPRAQDSGQKKGNKLNHGRQPVGSRRLKSGEPSRAALFVAPLGPPSSSLA